MSPFALAKQVFETEPCAYTFEECLLFHWKHGHIFSGKDFLVVGRYVPVDAPHDQIVGLHPFGSGNCLHVALMAGSQASAWAILPKEVKWISYERKNVLRFHRLARVRVLGKVFSHVPA